VVGGAVVHLGVDRIRRTAPLRATPFLPVMMRFGLTAQTGGLLMLITGTWLLATRGWADLRQPWLHIKLTIYVLLFIGGPLIARPAGQRMSAALAGVGDESADAVVDASMRRLGAYHLAALIGLVGIICLAVLGPA
jgi:hypothetical protein